MRFLVGEIVPLVEIVGLEGAVVTVKHRVGVALEQKRKRPASGAHVDRLPEAIEHQHMLVEHRIHNAFNWAINYTGPVRVSMRMEGCCNGWTRLAAWPQERDGRAIRRLRVRARDVA